MDYKVAWENLKTSLKDEEAYLIKKLAEISSLGKDVHSHIHASGRLQETIYFLEQMEEIESIKYKFKIDDEVLIVDGFAKIGEVHKVEKVGLYNGKINYKLSEGNWWYQSQLELWSRSEN